MARFSERMGLVKVALQTDEMDSPLRNSIWNFVSEMIPQTIAGGATVVREIATEVLRVPREKPTYQDERYWLLEVFPRLPWYTIYEVLDYVVANAYRFTASRVTDAEAVKRANVMLEREHSGFQFTGGELTRKIQPVTATEIELAMKRASAAGLAGVEQQIRQALVLYGKRPEPDYRNAIKEAISAVEGVVKLINGTRGGGLRGALEAVSDKIELHPSLKGGLDKLYGYTSDADGIRHAILEEKNIDASDALFMIVICSAFVSFLLSKAERAGLLKRG